MQSLLEGNYKSDCFNNFRFVPHHKIELHPRSEYATYPEEGSGFPRQHEHILVSFSSSSSTAQRSCSLNKNKHREQVRVSQVTDCHCTPLTPSLPASDADDCAKYAQDSLTTNAEDSKQTLGFQQPTIQIDTAAAASSAAAALARCRGVCGVKLSKIGPISVKVSALCFRPSFLPSTLRVESALLSRVLECRVRCSPDITGQEDAMRGERRRRGMRPGQPASRVRGVQPTHARSMEQGGHCVCRV